MSTTYGYGITIPAPAGLDPERYVITLGVHRRNGAALTKAEVAAIEAALAPMANPSPTPAGDPAIVAKHKAEADRAHAATVAKVTGKAPSKGKATSKAAAKSPRKVSKTPTRTAARRQG